MTISGKKIDYKYFLFDGCHKFYLLDSNVLSAKMKDCGYNKSDIYPIDQLPYVFYNSCSLRFIQTWKDLKTVVPQCRNEVTFKGFGRLGWTSQIDFHNDRVYTDEPAANFGYCRNITFKQFI